MKEIEIKKIFFEAFNFVIKENIDPDPEGTIEIKINFDNNDESEFKNIIVELEVGYEDTNYSISAKGIGLFGLLQTEFTKDILMEKDFQSLLVKPIIDKLRVYIGLVSEGIDGAVKIPDFNLMIDKEELS